VLSIVSFNYKPNGAAYADEKNGSIIADNGQYSFLYNTTDQGKSWGN
jgi:photosystem II stability/assembly factor-like uncharacterized protein